MLLKIFTFDIISKDIKMSNGLDNNKNKLNILDNAQSNVYFVFKKYRKFKNMCDDKLKLEH